MDETKKTDKNTDQAKSKLRIKKYELLCYQRCLKKNWKEKGIFGEERESLENKPKETEEKPQSWKRWKLRHQVEPLKE